MKCAKPDVRVASKSRPNAVHITTGPAQDLGESSGHFPVAILLNLLIESSKLKDTFSTNTPPTPRPPDRIILLPRIMRRE